MSQAVLDRVKAHGVVIARAAQEQGLAPTLLAGLVAVESGGNPWAVRYEPRYRWLFGDEPGERLVWPAGCDRNTEYHLQRCSWGLCQVMGGTARWLGFGDWLPRLVEPELNLTYGARFLARCLARGQGDPIQALQAYNGGSDPRYAGRVLTWAARIKEFEA